MLDFEILYQRCKNLNILFVEDYAPLQEKIVEILEDFFNIVTAANDGEDGLNKYIEFKKTHNKPYDIIITDIRMPSRDGVSLTKAIQEINENQVIIVLSAHQESKYLLEFINLGIAQFISKPVEPEKLLEVLNHVSRKMQNSNQPTLIDSDIVVLSDTMTWNKRLLRLSKDDIEIKLTKNELIIMELLVSNIEYICCIDSIIEHFYSKNIETSNENIRNMMSRLRKKVPEDAITNLYGLGYKLSRQN
jgi:DNA-binding response OmpR family regulator